MLHVDTYSVCENWSACHTDIRADNALVQTVKDIAVVTLEHVHNLLWNYWYISQTHSVVEDLLPCAVPL